MLQSKQGIKEVGNQIHRPRFLKLQRPSESHIQNGGELPVTFLTDLSRLCVYMWWETKKVVENLLHQNLSFRQNTFRAALWVLVIKLDFLLLGQNYINQTNKALVSCSPLGRMLMKG